MDNPHDHHPEKDTEAAPFSWSGEGLGYFGSAVTFSCAAS
jgi:hypothetical protein